MNIRGRCARTWLESRLECVRHAGDILLIREIISANITQCLLRLFLSEVVPFSTDHLALYYLCTIILPSSAKNENELLCISMCLYTTAAYVPRTQASLDRFALWSLSYLTIINVYRDFTQVKERSHILYEGRNASSIFACLHTCACTPRDSKLLHRR